MIFPPGSIKLKSLDKFGAALESLGSGGYNTRAAETLVNVLCRSRPGGLVTERLIDAPALIEKRRGWTAHTIRDACLTLQAEGAVSAMRYDGERDCLHVWLTEVN